MILMVCVFASALLLVSNGTDTDAGDKKEPAKPPVAEKDKPVSIPKNAIYTTSGEPGFKQQLVALFRRDKGGGLKGEHQFTDDLRSIENQGGGSSNVFIVRGEEIKDALSATRLVIGYSAGADEPRKYDAKDQVIVSKRYWLVVYLGTFGSEPPAWEFNSLSVSGHTIEFTYSKSKSRIHSHDIWKYYYWAALPELTSGTYQLRLFDSGKNRPSLIRFVDVP
jgi:hypothetical protein